MGRLKTFSYLLVALVVGGQMTPAVGQPSPGEPCKDAARRTILRLQQIKGLEFKNITAYEATGDAALKLPAGRPRSANLVIDGQAAGATMKSPQLLMAIGTDIIRSCPEVSTVNIGVNRSSWSETIGIFGDGSIRRFECLEAPSRQRQIQYGYINCDI
jgi:hypothetical protein